MKKILIVVLSALLIIIATDIFFYKSLYNKQITYITNLLDRQAQIVGISVDNTNNQFISDLNKIIFSEDISVFFSNPEQRQGTEEKMKLFFSNYEDLITGLKFYDNNRNEFTLKKDETGSNWLEQNFVLHVQGEIFSREMLIEGSRGYEYYLPVLKGDQPVGNLVASIDYNKYFDGLFSGFVSKNYQWQWVVSDSGAIIFSNYEGKTKYSQVDRIARKIENGAAGNIIHNIVTGGKSRRIISSFYSTQLLQRNIGLVFSSPTDIFQNYIIRNSVIVGAGTILLILLIFRYFWKYLKFQQSQIEKLKASEDTLNKMINEIPAGVVIYNKNREVIKANKAAVQQFGYSDETEMKGKIYPEPSVTDENNYFSKNLGGTFSPDQFLIIRKEIGELILFRNTIPVKYQGEDADLEMLFDVTMLESARKQAAKANTSKSEFLARMSYEVRTPLNGIIGMSDILIKHKLSAEDKDIVSLLRQSAEVLLNIINDILDFSKIESGKVILDEIPFNLREEIVYCYDLARTNINETQVKFNCSVDENVPDKVIGDPFRFRQILTNLLNHSSENTGQGNINLNCRLIEKTDGLIRLGFELSDTGRSFDKATLKKIFGDYINIDSKVHKDDDGSGFGTILARQLVELMGGEFSAVCPSGMDETKGTKINFSISVNSNETVDKNLHFENVRTFGNVRTLVITGNQTRDEEILNSLHKLGLTVTVTTYQKSTVNQIKANLNFPEKRYHLVVVLDDLEFNGFEAAKELWENKLTSHFITMLISSKDTKGNLLKCITLGVDHYVVKPFDIKELYDMVKSSFTEIDKLHLPQESETGNSNIRILIVEDNKMNQKVLGTMLKSLGYSFDFADDGFAGLIQAKTRRYDVIFMDLIMPEMDGFESARKILEYDDTLLIVAFTADSMPDSKRKAELSGIKEFIPKPVRIDDLKKFFKKHFIRN
jgi:signal transduction histidine kinase/CheY-like chemotaxis protein/uncharacterized protein YxeA